MSSDFDTILQEEQKAEACIANAEATAKDIILKAEQKGVEKEENGKKEADKSLASKVQSVDEDIAKKKEQFVEGVKRQVSKMEEGREELVKKGLEVLRKQVLV